MATYPLTTIIAYSGNNFDLNNIPLSPDVLAQYSTCTTLDVINCLPFSGSDKVNITVKVWNTINSTSYIKCTFSDGLDWYGYLNNFKYVSMDTVLLDITIDYWLTCGGVGNIKAISGLTTRHLCLDDTFGKYCMDDEILSPSEPLQLVSGGSYFNKTTSNNDYVIVESTIDLYELGSTTYNTNITFNSDGNGSCTIPKIPSLSTDFTSLSITEPDGTIKGLTLPCVTYFDGTNSQVKNGMAVARSLGVESAILTQYILPYDLFNVTIGSRGMVSLVSGKYATQAITTLPYTYTSVKNNRVLYGSHNQYCIANIASGNELKINPEDIYNNDTSPTIFCMADGRSGQSPFYRFQTINKNSSEWYINSVQGLQWQNAPIKYTGTSGELLTNQYFDYNQKLEMIERNRELGKSYASDLVNSISGLSLNDPMTWATSGVKAAASTANYIYENTIGYTDFQNKRSLEKAQFQSSQSVVAPTIRFPRSNSIRDLIGNGIYAYRYRYTDNDITKLDKVLTMYGYKDVKPTDLTDFTSGKYFNYVEATNLQIQTNIPLQLRIIEGVKSQIASGVRVWKVNPDVSYYELSNRP